MRCTSHDLAFCCHWIPRKLIAGLAALALFLSVPAAAQAQGIFLTSAGAINQSMGGAAVAAPLDSAGAMLWNSATISGLNSSEVAFNLGLVLPTTTLQSTNVGISGSNTGEPGVTPVPTMSFICKDACSPWTWGVGVFGIGGFSTNYAASAIGSPNQNPINWPQPFGLGRIFTHAEIFQVTPTVSYALTDKLSIGGGANLDIAFVQADPLTLAPQNGAIYGPGDGTRFAWGGGFQLGVYYITDYNWRLGASYKSTQWFEPLRFNSNDPAGNPVFREVAFDLPGVASVGAAYTGFERWLYAIDVRWFDYLSARGFKESGIDPTTLQVNGLGWRNVWGVSQGLQYEWTDNLTLRGGYTYIDNPIPSAQSMVNAGTPLIMKNFLSIGGSYKVKANVLANIAYTHGFQSSLSGPLLGGAGPNPTVTSIVSVDQLTAGVTVLF